MWFSRKKPTSLTDRQKSNIRFFAFYLINGTLDFELLHEKLSVTYHDHLQQDPEIFYKTCCVFINQEIKHHPDWPYTEKLGRYLYQTIESFPLDDGLFEDEELNFNIGATRSVTDAFKRFAHWYSIGCAQSPYLETISFAEILRSGATFTEQSFAIWANVVKIQNGNVVNEDHALDRVRQWMRFYFHPEYGHDIHDWEFELYGPI